MSKRVFLFAAMSLGLSSLGFAVPKINFTGMGLHGTSHISGTGLLPVTNFSSNVYTGQMKFFYDGDGNNAKDGLDYDFIGFCLTPNNVLNDPMTLAPGSPFNWTSGVGQLSGYEGTNPGTDAALDKVARLFKNSWATQAITKDHAAAFQLAVWDLMANPFTYGSLGGGLVSGTVATHYASFLAIAANTSLSGKMTLYKPNNFSQQGQLIGTYFEDFGGSSDPVPEPFTLAFGAAAVGVYIRKRSLSKKA